MLECQTLDYMRFRGVRFVVSERDFVNLTHWQVLPDGSIVVCASTAVSARESDGFASTRSNIPPLFSVLQSLQLCK